jgi:hypothetical protein
MIKGAAQAAERLETLLLEGLSGDESKLTRKDFAKIRAEAKISAWTVRPPKAGHPSKVELLLSRAWRAPRRNSRGVAVSERVR